jgi:mono/diheme cytochrome c family protein
MQKWIGVVALLTACAGETTRVDDILALNGDVDAGETLYGNNCASGCHDADGSATVGVGNDIRGLGEADIVDSVVFPPTSSMNGLADFLSDQEIADIAAYATTL